MSHKTNLHFTTVVFFSLFCWFFKRKVNLLGKGRKKFNPQLPQAYHPLFATVCNHDLSYNHFCRYLTILKSVFMAMYIMWFCACERTLILWDFLGVFYSLHEYDLHEYTNNTTWRPKSLVLPRDLLIKTHEQEKHNHSTWANFIWTSQLFLYYKLLEIRFEK